MNSSQLKKEVLPQAKKITRRAGVKIQHLFNKKQKFSLKEKGSIVTESDKIAEDILIKGIKKAFPKHSILSEEAGEDMRESDYIWVIDPIDGTTNFAMKNPFFNTTISLNHKNKPILALVYAPIFDEFYWAIKEGGAYLNQKRLKISKEEDRLEYLLHNFCHGSEKKDKEEAADYYKYFLQNGYQIRQLGAAALEIARIAAGITDSIYVPGANPWDVAAGVLIVKEAGGVVTDLQGDDYTLKSKDGVLASINQASHRKLLNIIREND